jgi:hypothetical protein
MASWDSRFVLPLALVLGTYIGVQNAGATLLSVSAFTGTYSETFEGFPQQSTQLFVPNPTPAFGGHASFTVSGSTGVNAIAIYEGSSGPDQYSNYQPSDGTQLAVTQDFGQTITLAFDTLANKFGGFFGGDPLSFNFLDSGGASVGSASVTPASSGGTLAFVGYSSSANFKTVQITATNPTAIVLDGLQVVAAPEPTSLALCALGLGVLLQRRRRPATTGQPLL